MFYMLERCFLAKIHFSTPRTPICSIEIEVITNNPTVQILPYFLFRGGVTLCAPRARARAVFGPDKCKDLCGHAQFLLRNVPEKDFETGARPVSKT